MDLAYEIAIGVIAIIVEIAAVAVTISARRRMSNPSLLKCMGSVILATISLTGFSVWHTAREAFGVEQFLGMVPDVPEHIFFLAASALFLHSAWVLLSMSRQYGLREQGKRIASETGKDSPGLGK